MLLEEADDVNSERTGVLFHPPNDIYITELHLRTVPQHVGFVGDELLPCHRLFTR